MSCRSSAWASALVGVFAIVSTQGCDKDKNRAEEKSDAAIFGSERVEFSKIDGMDGNSDSMASLSLCALVRHPMFGPAGLYRVERLSGVREEDLWNPGTTSGFTYVELERMDSWYDADDRMVTARILGGPSSSGKAGGWSVSLSVGETVGLLLVKAVAENRGYYGLHTQGTFHRTDDGGYTNGILFTREHVDADELGDLVAGLAGAGLDAPCPYDRLPDYGSPSDEDAGRPDESVHTVVHGSTQHDAGR